MRSRHLAAAVVAALGMAACSDAPSAPNVVATEAPAVRQTAKGGEPIKDQYIVVFKDDVRDAPGLAKQLANAHGGKVRHSYEHAIKGFAANLPAAAAEALRRNPNVAYVEQDQVVTPSQVGSWGLDRVDQRDLPLNGVYNYTQTGAGVTAYIIDTGIETSHSQFGGRAWAAYDALGGNGQDCNGHGTHVAGTVGGSTYGVAKAVSLVGVRVFPCSGGSAWSTIIAGIDWVRYNRVLPAVANLSLSGGAMQSVDDAIQNLVNSGVTTVVAAGNASDNACYYSPARAAAAITVGASNSGDQQAWFSNWGGCVDVYAPGEGITSSTLYGGVTSMDGTSMAAPHVAGAAALYLQGNPSATPATVGSAILGNATTYHLGGLGAGSPNLLLYTLSGGVVTPPPSTLSAYIDGPSEIYAAGTHSWSAYASGGNGSYTYQWQYSVTGTWTNVGTNSPTYSRFVSGTAPSFSLRVIVTSGGVSYTSPEFWVYKEPMCGKYAC